MQTVQLALAIQKTGREGGMLAGMQDDLPRLAVELRRLADRFAFGARVTLNFGVRGARVRHDLGQPRRRMPSLKPEGTPHSKLNGRKGQHEVLINIANWSLDQVDVCALLAGDFNGHHLAEPAIVRVRGKEISREWWVDGADVTESVTSPAMTLGDAAAWSAELAVFAGPHPTSRRTRSRCRVGRAGSLLHGGVDADAGALLGWRQRALPSPAAQRVPCRTRGPRNVQAQLLSIMTSERATFCEVKRQIAGLLDGDSTRAPAISRIHLSDSLEPAVGL